ncbi:MAG: hypothetical protein AABY86_04110, partial [Bdellovibrionota bacterium]
MGLKDTSHIGIVIIVILVGLVGCVSNDQLKEIEATSSIATTTTPTTKTTTVNIPTSANYVGCLSGQTVSTSKIYIKYEYPADASKVVIFRNGAEVYTSSLSAWDDFVDADLLEGQTYTYTCAAYYGAVSVLGSNTLEVSTFATNPPTFAGIDTVTALNAHSVVVTWDPPTGGGALGRYKIFGNPGSTLNWNASARQSVAATNASAVITALGDQLPYIWGVRACTASGLCDTNVVTRTITMPDDGAPTTTGATSAQVVNGQIILTVPWTEAAGAVKRRKVYQRTGPVGGTDINNYTLAKTVLIADADLGNPTTSITIESPTENTSYHFIVRDEDPALQLSANTAVVSITTTDLSPPIFAGITGLVVGAPTNTVLQATFVAIAAEPGDASGASDYLFYTTTAQLPAVPADP